MQGEEEARTKQMLQSTRFLMMCATVSVVTTMLLITPAVDATTGVHSILTLLVVALLLLVVAIKIF